MSFKHCSFLVDCSIERLLRCEHRCSVRDVGIRQWLAPAIVLSLLCVTRDKAGADVNTNT